MKTNKKISKILYYQSKWTVLFCITVLSLMIFTIQSCERESINETKNLVTSAVVSKTSTIGNVQSSNDEPIANAVIKLGDKQIAQTNSQGKFIVGDTIQSGDVLSIQHPDFVTLYKVIEDNTEFFFQMKKRAEVKRIYSQNLSVLNIGGGAQIGIPPNAFSNNGVLFTGAVDIQATFIDVTDDSDLVSAPGVYIAETNLGGLYPLQSYGMMEIMATIAGTDIELSLADNKSIRISFPILDEGTPDKVNLYELNPITGYWSSIGVLTTVNGRLQGSITTINGGYNADKPCANRLVCVKVKIEYKNGDPKCSVGLKGLSYRGFSGLYIPNEDGYVRFWGCPDSVIQLRACRSNDPAFNQIFDLSNFPLDSSGCIDLGVWTINN